MSELEQLLLERDIGRVLIRYARMCDERDWAALDDIFSDDASADYGGWQLRDRAAILSMLRRHLDGCGPTQHLLGNLEVTVAGETVTSRVAVRAAHRGADDLVQETYDCLGEYQDRWTLTPNGWRIAHRSMKVRLEFGSRTLLRPAA